MHLVPVARDTSHDSASVLDNRTALARRACKVVIRELVCLPSRRKSVVVGGSTNPVEVSV